MGALGSLLATLLRANSRNFVCRTRFSSIWAPFGYENQRNSDENLRNHGENLRPAPRIKRRIPTRVRRSREANSIRRTLDVYGRERSVQNTLPNVALLGSLPPLTPPLASASPPYPPTWKIPTRLGEFFLLKSSKFALLALSWALFGGFNTALGRSWLGVARFLSEKSLQENSRRAPKSDLRRS